MRGRLTAGVLAASLIAAGCAAEPPVSPLPTEAPTSAAPSRSPAGVSPRALPPTSARPSPPAPSRSSRRPAVTTSPGRTPTTTPPQSSSCQGAVVHTIDLTTDELALVRALCVAVGAVLRIENIGPGEVTTDSPDLVDPNYAAGVVEIRFVRPGTVVVTIPQNGTPHDITVVVR